ncbi:MAG: bifunctional methylenetetrahydrofolate dehydrogenase/methenyltetrahydrofolate cyclohydrolase FolD [Clostridia bacterium]|nr:bifunctional methylenetetrahydrofolate dehydrogenase/methenyltetrahydrofolate cyclohydrolase FolD [Clostridia bacterium]
MYKILDGKTTAAEVKAKVAEDVVELKECGVTPGLAVIIVGNDPASRVYVDNKEKDCAQVGIRSTEYALLETTSQEELLSLIHKLNNDPEVDGILCQLPLPLGLDEKTVIGAITPEKDVDCFHPENVGHVMQGDYTFLPCTPAGIMKLLERECVDVSGKHCVVIGRSNIVGKPMAMLMLNASATVTVCHSKTRNLADYTRCADILVSAVGKAGFITADMVKPGSVVIDVGMNRNSQGKLCGDVDFENVAPLCSYITPVPGGVGPMTRAELLVNTVSAAKKRK